MKDHPALLWMCYMRAVAWALCWSGLGNLGIDFDPAEITRGEILVHIHASFLFCILNCVGVLELLLKLKPGARGSVPYLPFMLL